MFDISHNVTAGLKEMSWISRDLYWIPFYQLDTYTNFNLEGKKNSNWLWVGVCVGRYSSDGASNFTSSKNAPPLVKYNIFISHFINWDVFQLINDIKYKMKDIKSLIKTGWSSALKLVPSVNDEYWPRREWLNGRNINIFLLFVGGKQVRKLIIPVDV